MAVATGESLEAIEARYDGAGYGKFKEDVGEAVVAPSTRSGFGTRICAAIPASCTRSSRAARRRRTRTPPKRSPRPTSALASFRKRPLPEYRPSDGSYRATAAPLTRRLVAGLVDWMIVTVFFLIAQIPLGVLQATAGWRSGESRSGRFSSSRRRPGSRIAAGYFAFFFSTGQACARNARSGHPRRRGGDRPDPFARARRRPRSARQSSSSRVVHGLYVPVGTTTRRSPRSTRCRAPSRSKWSPQSRSSATCGSSATRPGAGLGTGSAGSRVIEDISPPRCRSGETPGGRSFANSSALSRAIRPARGHRRRGPRTSCGGAA